MDDCNWAERDNSLIFLLPVPFFGPSVTKGCSLLSFTVYLKEQLVHVLFSLKLKFLFKNCGLILNSAFWTRKAFSSYGMEHFFYPMTLNNRDSLSNFTYLTTLDFLPNLFFLRTMTNDPNPLHYCKRKINTQVWIYSQGYENIDHCVELAAFFWDKFSRFLVKRVLNLVWN